MRHLLKGMTGCPAILSNLKKAGDFGFTPLVTQFTAGGKETAFHLFHQVRSGSGNGVQLFK
jgi:hypothetical protein